MNQHLRNILIVYSTTDGHTPRICAHMKRIMEGPDWQVTILALEQANPLDLSTYDRIVIGASIRYGKHQPAVARFIERHQSALERQPSAFFTVNIVARKPNKNRPDTNPYLLKYLRQISWKPQLLGVFAGKLDYPKYGFFDRQMIRFIMLITKGPTDPKTVVEFTDWAQVEVFARQLLALKPA
jgi:menaquinone-dependent protoporphyrinogen oxidase